MVLNYTLVGCPCYFYTHENKTKWHVAPKRQRGAAAKHLVKPLTAQRCSHRLNHSTIEPLNQKSQIAREYGLLPADTNCHPVKLPLQTKENSRYVRLLWKQNLWMATNWKRYLKSEFALFSDVVNLIQILFNFSNVGDIFWGWDPKRPYLSLEKEKKLLNGGAELSRTRLEPKQNFFVKIFRNQCGDGGNAEMPMDSNDQYRLCNCSFKVKIIFLIRLKRRNVRAKFWSFSSNLHEVGLRYYMWQVFKSRIFDPRRGYKYKVKAQLDRKANCSRHGTELDLLMWKQLRTKPTRQLMRFTVRVENRNYGLAWSQSGNNRTVARMLS